MCPEVSRFSMGARSGVSAGALQKFPESEYLKTTPGPPELGHCPWSWNWSRRRKITIGAGDGAVQNFPGSQLCMSTLGHAALSSCLEPSWPLGVLLAARRPPGQTVLSGALGAPLAAHPARQAWGTHRDDREIAQWIVSSGVPSIRPFRACPQWAGGLEIA